MYNVGMDYALKLDQLLSCVRGTSDMRARSDLFKMYTNCKKLYTQLDIALIECKRRGRITTEYQEIEQKLNESITEFEQWITFATLLYN